MDRDVEIDGVAFMSLWHHDGKMVRGAGLFALARRDADGGHTILHSIELAQDISRVANVSHPRWDYAVSQGMNEILVHLAGSQQSPGETGAGVECPPIRWALHPDDAEVAEDIDDLNIARVG